ncbi:hypothetical protein So717_01140 [Roseobacter cerasinus]|uniref:Subtilase family protein n=1 Tax=Roseobacter cerasinus TaxID=2602289 RepID=A0A640VMQ1_9RHOB|nr:S8 family serine peptidase [Roseobacter cerasinus]GFE48361.1 hypothetical protein So717_01140 [Roseobacter cerasinus]
MQDQLDLMFEEDIEFFRQRVVDVLPTIHDLLRCAKVEAPYFLETPDEHGELSKAEVEELLRKQNSKERAARRAEILAEVDDIAGPFLDQISDYAGPPGSVLKLVSLMSAAGYVIGYHFKHLFGRPRPSAFDPRVDPIIDVPTHSSYPSAHAVQTHLIAHALAEVYEDSSLVGRLFDVAERISVNREYAGVHYSSDSEAGKLIAQAAFPILRLVMDEPFVEAVAEMNPALDTICAATGRVPGSALEPPEDRDPDGEGLPWNLVSLGVDHLSEEHSGAGTVVALFDTAVKVDHSAIAEAISGEFVNLDYPLPLNDPWCMGSKGIGHGTAMAGLIVGETEQGRRLGVAPKAKLTPVRCANLARDSHDDRFDLGVALLALGLNGHRPAFAAVCDSGSLAQRMAAVVLSLDFPRPDVARNQYITANELQKARNEGRIEALLDQARRGARQICDPFALAILLVQNAVPVVIPAGNRGGEGLAYPGAFEDYEPLLGLLGDEDGRSLVLQQLVEMMKQFNRGTSSSVLEQPFESFLQQFDSSGQELRVQGRNARRAFRDGQEAQTVDADALDAFAGTGIVVVGASYHKDITQDAPAQKAAEVTHSGYRRSEYSQYGPGLCVLAPSDRDGQPATRCHRYGFTGLENALGAHTVPVTTSDLPGPGGFSGSNTGMTHAGQQVGFGGTSAAAAQVAGVLALLAAQSDELLSGPDLRTALIALAEPGIDLEAIEDDPKRKREHGYGMVDLSKMGA